MTNKGKMILVTGATGGIGKATCQRLAEEGYSLILASRTLAKLEKHAEQLSSKYGSICKPIPVDMTDETSIAGFASRLNDSNIALDGIVMMPPQIPPTNECLPPSETWRTILHNSFVGPLELLKTAIATMKPNLATGKRGKVVIISGISSAQVLGHYATSNVLRCAWLAEAKTLAFALGERGIHVNTLSLGGTLTEDYRAALQRRANNTGLSYSEKLVEEWSCPVLVEPLFKLPLVSLSRSRIA